jgi:hypothetical protein
MNKTFSLPHIPIVFFLILLISKEIFSYDGERVVILCILTFVLTAYFQLREGISQMFELRTQKIEEEFVTLLQLKIKLEESIKNFWLKFKTLEKQVIQVLFWLKLNVKNYINKNNKNRTIFSSKLLKDQLNSISKDNLAINYKLNNALVDNNINNFKLILQSKINFIGIDLPINFFLEKIKESDDNNYNFKHLLLNKLNSEVVETSFNGLNWYNSNIIALNK